ncbi:metallophosphoesterase [Truepera radiovictrix]|uniref:metallophosphoesterase n=1 Tax=Truepera radiovictrix TaxID=332249 RepID=UPI0002FCFD94|nr:metallophosphoesterase [Truepera radiovictrix]WMT56219.1 metallophosphoesterase [Truepera radiovictrix]
MSEAHPLPTHVIGDLHGHLAVFEGLLGRAGLCRDGRWSGGAARLLLLGDFFNRGPQGLGCLELAMRLQEEAERASGGVEALIGNHDLLLLAAYRFGEGSGSSGTFVTRWRDNGGVAADLERFGDAHATWLSARPALLRAGGTLYLHADATFYDAMGASIEAVNRAFWTLLAGRDAAAWERLLDAFAEHKAFWGAGERRARGTLERFGARRLVHAHTPISKLTGQPSATVTAPLVYHGGLCTDVDHELYRGGPGFIYRP